MALLAKVGTFNAGTGSLGATIAVTGVGFQPKVLILWLAGLVGVEDSWNAGSHQRSFGVATSPTSRWAISTQSENGQAAADCDRVHHQGCCLITLTTAGVESRLLDLQSFDADGFTLVYDMASSQDQRIHYLALGGADITDVATGRFDEPAAIGSQSTTGVGFQPDFVLFGSVGLATDPAAIATDSTFMVGAAVSATQEAVFCGESENASLDMDTQSYCRSGECIALIGGTEDVDGRAEFTSMDADGFTLNWLERAADRVIFWLAIKGGGFAVGDFVTSTSNGATIAESGLGFAPKAALLTSAGKAANAQDAVSSHDQWACGAFTGPTERGAQVIFDEDGVAASDVERAFESDQCLAQFTAAPSYVGLVDVQSMDADGFTLVMDSGGASAAFAWYAAFGDTPEPPDPPPPPPPSDLALSSNVYG